MSQVLLVLRIGLASPCKLPCFPASSLALPSKKSLVPCPLMDSPSAKGLHAMFLFCAEGNWPNFEWGNRRTETSGERINSECCNDSKQGRHSYYTREKEVLRKRVPLSSCMANAEKIFFYTDILPRAITSAWENEIMFKSLKGSLLLPTDKLWV